MPKGNTKCMEAPADYLNVCCAMWNIIYKEGKKDGCITGGSKRCEDKCYCPITDKDEWNND